MFFIFFILTLILILVFLFYLIYCLFEIYLYLFKRYVVFAPTKSKKLNIEQIFIFLKSINLSKGKFIDLGCGDGRMVREFAKRGFESYGIDVNYFLILVSKLITKLQKLNNAYFLKNDFFKFDLRDFDIIYIYQLPKVNKIIVSKFKEELKPGSIVISFVFNLPNDERIKLVKKIDKFFIYKVE